MVTTNPVITVVPPKDEELVCDDAETVIQKASKHATIAAIVSPHFSKAKQGNPRIVGCRSRRLVILSLPGNRYALPPRRIVGAPSFATLHRKGWERSTPPTPALAVVVAVVLAVVVAVVLAVVVAVVLAVVVACFSSLSSFAKRRTCFCPCLASEIGPGFSLGNKAHPKTPSTLPKAGVKPAGRNDQNIAFAFAPSSHPSTPPRLLYFPQADFSVLISRWVPWLLSVRSTICHDAFSAISCNLATTYVPSYDGALCFEP